MKTIEEKAKAYDNALGWMREVYPTLTGATKEDAEHYFPELRESEDERIRKEAISIVQSYMNICDKEGDPCLSGYKVLAYLEKQKELLTPEEKMNHPLYLEGFDVGRKVGQVEAEQKPAWSEEDEEILDSVIRIITHFDDLAHKPTFAGPKWTHPYSKEIRFLNKLRNRLLKND